MTKQFRHERLEPPSHFQKQSFRTVTPKKGVRVVVARPKGSTKTRAQAVLREKGSSTAPWRRRREHS